ncbi:MAG: cation transporter [Bacteroidetes bacterium]|nr:cation transporter [Bacteroidota bacterium]
MTHTYQLTGMTCTSCEAKVKSNLLALPDVTSVEVSKDDNSATISMAQHISLANLQEAIGGKESKYQISATQHNEVAEEAKSWLATYKPLLIIFAFITGISLLTARTGDEINGMHFMQNFMAGFFITFSFFKLLDVKAFAETYSMYDIVAMRIKSYGYVYPFIELALGIAYLIGFYPFVTNIATLIVMGVSIIGVLQSVLNKQKIQCACLGSVFNLPMSTVTIIEDALMIAMAGGMLVLMN